MHLFCDLETYSETPIQHGTHRYAEKAEVLLWAYAMGDRPVKVWDVTTGAPMPSDLKDALADPEVMTVWHNGAMFDRVVLKHALGIEIPIERVHDTMVQALTHGLPGALGALSRVLDVGDENAKDSDGRRLIQLFCKPRPEGSKVARFTRETHPEDWAKFIEYAKSDILAMREAMKKMPMWNYRGVERELWHLDQRINNRGVRIDLELAQAATKAVEKEQKSLAERARNLTGGAVQAATQRDALLTHILDEYGVTLPDMTKATLERRVNDPELPIALRELLAIRLEASTTSTAKYKTLLRSTSSDGRLRGTLQFCGASRTGRWAGRLFQPQNIARGTIGGAELELGIEALKAGCADLIEDAVIELCSSGLRGSLIASDGKKLVVADLSNIEGRMLAWLAGEEWKIQAFTDFDAGKGHDLYKLAYANAFGIEPEDVTKDQRQVGKVMELTLGYQGGVGAFITFSLAYGIDLEAMAEAAAASIPSNVRDEAERAYEWAKREKRTFGLTKRAYMVCDAFKRLWRNAHPQVSSMWFELERAVTVAVSKPGTTYQCRRLKIRRDGNWLRIALPSGRALCYPSPAMVDGKITYMGNNQYTRKWERIKTYGGKLSENVTQAAARDVLASSMLEAEAQGYEILLTVHDELITETPDSDEFSAEGLAAIMATNPEWSEGLPLAAEGFETYRYRK